MTKSPSRLPADERVSTKRRRSRAPLVLAALAGTTAFLGAATVATLCRYPELWREPSPSTTVFRVQSRSMEPAFLGPRFVWRCPKCGESFATTLDVASSGGALSDANAPTRGETSNADSPEARQFRTTARFFSCPRCGFDRVPASSAVFQDGVLVETTDATATQPPTESDVKSVAATLRAWRRRVERLRNGEKNEPRPERWDVVVFRAPTGRATLKRVVGLPGETLEIVAGDVFVDGRVAFRTLEQIVSTATRLDSTQIRRTDDRLTVVATTPIWNAPPSPETPSSNEFPQTVFATTISNESPTPRWNGDDPAPVEPVRDFLLDFDWASADGTPTRFRLLARRPKRVFLLDFDEMKPTISLRSLPFLDGKTSAGRTFDELTYDDFADAPVEKVRRGDAKKTSLTPDAKTSSDEKNAPRFRVFLVDGELILARNGVELARFSTDDADDPATTAISAPFALLGDVARAFAPVLRRDLHYSSVEPSTPRAVDAEPPRYFLLGDNSPASLDSRFEQFGTIDADALLFRVAPTFDEF
ncbi:MAG: hypothetical protein IKU86_09120 [Thermoguttaceae bacterium]|nr:hypothetical protein [Thermoguttaceae bacterium]